MNQVEHLKFGFTGFFVRVVAEGITYFKPVSSQITISSIVLVLTITFCGLVSSVVGMLFVVVSMLHAPNA
jgi:hypothetical protein